MSIFYTNPRITALLVLFVTLFGLIALGGLARQEDPTMTERYASVSTFLPGATANRVESLISEPLETGLREIPEIRVMESNSRAGYSLVSIELYDHVGPAETDVVWSEVRDKLGELHPALPAGTSVPLLEIRAPIASTLVVGLTWDMAGEPALSILTRLARSLEVRLANLPNTRETEIHGEAEEEVLVTVDPYRLGNAGLAPADVASRIAAADTKVAAGRLRNAGADVLLEVAGELDSPERIARIPLKTAADGAVVRVSDTGPGLPEKARENLFVPFKGSTGARGTGLGLAIVAELVEANGGRVELEKSDERGTSFIVELPVGPSDSG